MNRIREGVLSESDKNALSRRVTLESHLDLDSLHVFYTNQEVSDHNEKMLNKIDKPLITLKAKKYGGPKNFNPSISSDGRIANTQFFDSLKIKIGARCALTWNISTQDGLVNGASGVIVGLEKKRLSKDKFEAIIVTFDDEKTGQNQRQKYAHISKKYEHLNGTPIISYEHEYNIISRKGFKQAITAKIDQYPIRIYYASTAHKMQGQTVKAGNKVVIHWHKHMQREKGMAYVMLGRTQKIEDIYISGTLNFEGISCSDAALKESRRLLEEFESMEKESSELLKTHWKLCYLNVRSVKSSTRKKNVLKENFLLSSDVFALSETWLDINDKFEVNGFEETYANGGKGKGVLAFSKIHLKSEPLRLVLQDFTSVKLRTNNFDIILLYVSSSCDQNKVCEVLLDLIDISQPTVVMGDMNFDTRHSDIVSKFMNEKSFEQIVEKSTHEKGNLIDHIYVNNALKNIGIKHSQTASFVSDHDILALYVKKHEQDH